MSKYRKKPVVIEAHQMAQPIAKGSEPEWLRRAILADVVVIIGMDGPMHWLIKTLEGTMRADIGDYIIKGVQGELYPCKPDIFAATYDAVD